VTEDVNIGFTDQASHGYWHFVDAALSADGSTLPPTPSPNAATQISALRSAIASSEEDLLKAYDLAWLEHIVGDVHQPLHGAIRYIGNKGDAGGNTLKITMPAAMKKKFMGTLGKSAPSELHAFWDDLPGEGDPAPVLPIAMTFAKGLPAATISTTDTDPALWAAESLNLATSDAYMSPVGPTLKAAITQAYYNAALKDAKLRIAQAGARLAKLLNENLK